MQAYRVRAEQASQAVCYRRAPGGIVGSEPRCPLVPSRRTSPPACLAADFALSNALPALSAALERATPTLALRGAATKRAAHGAVAKAVKADILRVRRRSAKLLESLASVWKFVYLCGTAVRLYYVPPPQRSTAFCTSAACALTLWLPDAESCSHSCGSFRA